MLGIWVRSAFGWDGFEGAREKVACASAPPPDFVGRTGRDFAAVLAFSDRVEAIRRVAIVAAKARLTALF